MSHLQMGCPYCSASISYRPEWKGKQGKCLNCGNVLTFGEDPVAIAERLQFSPSADEPATSSASPRRVTRAPAGFAQQVQKRAAVRDLTTWEVIFVRTFVTLAIMGALSMILPHFGLQFRKLNRPGMDPMVLGPIMMGIGACVAALFYFKRYLSKEAAAIGRKLVLGVLALGFVMIAGFFAMVVWFAVKFERGHTMPPTAPPEAHRIAPGYAAPAPRPAVPGAPPAGGAMAHVESVKAELAAVAQRAEQARKQGELVTLTLRNCSKEQADELSAGLASLRVTRRLRPGSDGTYTLEVFPVKEMKQVIMNLSSGDIAEMDEQAKTITLDF